MSEATTNPFAKRCYTMSEPHLSGYRLIVGFERLEDAQEAHIFVANAGREACQPEPSPQPAVPVVSEDDLVACLISSGCVGTVKMSFESGPMSITRPSLNATKFARAILALRPAVEPMTREQMIAAVRPLCSAEAHAEKLVDLSMDEYRAIEAHHGIAAKAEGGA